LVERALLTHGPTKTQHTTPGSSETAWKGSPNEASNMHANQGIDFGGTYEPQRTRMPNATGKAVENATNKGRIPKRQGMDNMKPASHFMGGQSSHDTAQTNERPIGAMKAAKKRMVEHVHPKGPMGRFARVRPMKQEAIYELHSDVRAQSGPVARSCGRRHQLHRCIESKAGTGATGLRFRRVPLALSNSESQSEGRIRS